MTDETLQAAHVPFPELPAILVAELSADAVEACENGDFTSVVRTLRRRAWRVLAVGGVLAVAAVAYWLHHSLASGRYSLLILFVLILVLDVRDRFVALRRRAQQLESWGRKAPFRRL